MLSITTTLTPTSAHDTPSLVLTCERSATDAGGVTTTSAEQTGSPDEEMAMLRARLAALESAGRSPSRRRGKRAVSAVALVVAGVALLAVGDWYEQNREMEALVSSVEAHQDAYQDLSKQWGALGADGNVGGDLTKQRGVLNSVRPEMLMASGAAEDVTVMPWHRSIGKTRDAFVDYYAQNDKLLAAIGSAAEDFDTAPMDAAQMTAEAELPKAVPMMPLYNLDKRVKTYLAQQEENYAGG